MQALVTLISPFVSIVAHGAGPQHLPRSGLLFGIVVFCHLALFTAGMLALDVPPPRTYMLPLLDVLTQGAFFSVLLIAMGLQARILQTLTAVFGTDFLLNVISVPLALVDTAAPGSPLAIVLAVVAIGVIMWSLSVKGHILRNAAGLPYYVGVIIALAFFVAYLAIDAALFGAPV